MTDLSALIERLEIGSGEDRELDRDVYELVKKGRAERASHEVIAARYTGSIDAALAFAEAVLPGWHAIIYTDTVGVELYDATLKIPKGIQYWAEAATLARALCAATIKALQAKETQRT